MGNMATNTIVRNGLLALGGVMMLITLYLIFIWVPTEKNLGVSQRIFYFHVPLAWTGFLAFFFVLVGSVGYLWKKTDGWDRMAYAAAEIGVVYTTLLLVTGILWSKPVWGVWWDWGDARMMSTTVMFFFYLGYLALRRSLPDQEIRAKRSAILAIVAFVQVPIVHFSVQWFRTLHQGPTILRPDIENAPVDPEFARALGVNMLAFLALFATLLTLRVTLAALEADREQGHRGAAGDAVTPPELGRS